VRYSAGGTQDATTGFFPSPNGLEKDFRQPLMDYSTSLESAWIAVHLLGLMASWLVRIYSGSRHESLTQGFFLVCLAAVALATVVGHYWCLSMWPLSAGLLSVMIVIPILGSDVERPAVA